MKFLIICLLCGRTIQDPDPKDAPTSYAVCDDCKKNLKEVSDESKVEKHSKI